MIIHKINILFTKINVDGTIVKVNEGLVLTNILEKEFQKNILK